jgi:DNA-binding transcriptional LysR family regulator
MNPNLNDMLCFLAVVEARSFSAAAAQLNRTRSAVSQSITRLEDDLGVRLLYRSTRTLSLTEAGTKFVGRCKEIKAIYHDAVSLVRDNSQQQIGSIVVTAPHALSDSDLIPALAEFTSKYPNLRVRIIADDARLDLIEEQVDLALRVGEPTGHTARISKVGIVQEALYASADYVAGRGGVPDEPSELASWDHIANAWQGTPVIYKIGSGAPLKVEPRIRVNTFYQLRSGACASLGVARLPDRAVTDLVKSGTLVRLVALGSMSAYAVHHFDRRPPKWITALVGMLRRQMKRG